MRLKLSVSSLFLRYAVVVQVFDFDNSVFDMGFGMDGMEAFGNFSGRSPSDGENSPFPYLIGHLWRMC